MHAPPWHAHTSLPQAVPVSLRGVGQPSGSFIHAPPSVHAFARHPRVFTRIVVTRCDTRVHIPRNQMPARVGTPSLPHGHGESGHGRTGAPRLSHRHGCIHAHYRVGRLGCTHVHLRVIRLGHILRHSCRSTGLILRHPCCSTGAHVDIQTHPSSTHRSTYTRVHTSSVHIAHGQCQLVASARIAST